MARTVGLSGGIGSGKSSVSRMFAKLGASVIDADAIVHELQAPGEPMLAEIASSFGPEVLDPRGALRRAALARLIFGDAQARARLDAIVHPPVGAEMLRRVAAARTAGAPLVLLDIPLLFEGGRTGFDATLLVWVPVEIQIERTMRRDDCSREQVLQRIKAQLPIDRKRELADHVIDNSGSLEETHAQVCALFQALSSPP